MTFGLEIETTNKIFLDQIELIQSKKYKNDVEECLINIQSVGKFSFIDVSCINPKFYKKRDYGSFDHIYVNQQVNGGFSDDDFAGYIYIPITKKLYLKSYYSI